MEFLQIAIAQFITKGDGIVTNCDSLLYSKCDGIFTDCDSLIYYKVRWNYFKLWQHSLLQSETDFLQIVTA